MPLCNQNNLIQIENGVFRILGRTSVDIIKVTNLDWVDLTTTPLTSLILPFFSFLAPAWHLYNPYLTLPRLEYTRITRQNKWR